MVFSLFRQPETIDLGNVVAEALCHPVDILRRQRVVENFFFEVLDSLLADAFPVFAVEVVIAAVVVISSGIFLFYA